MQVHYKNTLTKIEDIRQTELNGVKGNYIEAYFADFDTKDSDGDVFIKGAFKKSITENGPKATNRIKHLMHHDILRPLGLITDLQEDNKGLKFLSFIPDTTEGADSIKLYKIGVYNEHSVGFFPLLDKMDNKGDTTYFREVRLLEGSTVTWGANENTPLVGIKSKYKDRDYVSDRLTKLTKAIKDGTFTDDTFKLLELEFNQLQKYLDTLTTEKPSDDTSDADEPLTIEEFRKLFKLK